MFDEREPAEIELTPDLKAIEGRLARLVPAGARVDRDRLLYEAGSAAERATSERSPGPSLRGKGNVWVWRISTGLMAAASLLLSTMLVWQRQSFELALHELKQPVIATQIAGEQLPVTATSPVAPNIRAANWIALRQPTVGYLGVRFTALTHGVGAIEAAFETRGTNHDSSRDRQRSQRDLLNELLPSTHVESIPKS